MPTLKNGTWIIGTTFPPRWIANVSITWTYDIQLRYVLIE